MYTIVTAIFDLKKYHPGINRWRSPEKYLKLFNYIYDFNLPTILFIEKQFINKIKPRNNLIIVPFTIEDLPNFNKISDNLPPVNNGKHVDKYFCTVINSKFYLMKEALKYLNNNETSHLVWLDSGIAHMGINNNFCEDIKCHFYKDKIVVYLMKMVDKNIDLNTFFDWSKGNIAAGIAIFPINMINWYEEEYNKIFEIAIKKIMPYEEQVMAAMVSLHEDKFEYLFGDYGGILKNLRQITIDMNCVIDNLSHCRIIQSYDVGMKIIKIVIKSISKAQNNIDRTDFIRFCYEAQIISFYMDKDLSLFFSKILSFMYQTDEIGNKWILERYDNVKLNLSFNNINIDDKINEEEILNLDKDNILWRVL
jgi:hypothetical protein